MKLSKGTSFNNKTIIESKWEIPSNTPCFLCNGAEPALVPTCCIDIFICKDCEKALAPVRKKAYKTNYRFLKLDPYIKEVK